MSSTPFWRKISQTVSAQSQNITDNIIAEILNLTKSNLLEGLLIYKPYAKSNYEVWYKTANVSNYMKEFVHELSQDLNLDTNMTYLIMCNYLMFEYYGKIKEFWQITRIGTTIRLKESIWNFYTAERMFLLKTLRHIFEFVDDLDYEFSKQYQEFLNSIKVEELQNNLIKQFECLTSEITQKNFDEDSKYLENWLCRNNREQIEVLMILMLTSMHSSFTVTQLTQLLKLLAQTNFNMQPIFYEATRLAKPQDVRELIASQIGSYFVLLESYWDQGMADFWTKPSTAEIDKILLNVQTQSNQTVIALTWILLKSKSVSLGEEEEHVMEFLSRKPFVFLHSIISNDIFKNCRVGEIVLKATHKMMDEFCLMFIDRKLLYEQEGLISVAAEFLTQQDLTAICLKTRNGLDTVIEIAFQTFPYDFYSLTEISKSLLGQENQYKNTIHLLNNVPSFLSDMTWSTPKEEIVVLKTEQPAFPDSDLIVFPPNTPVRSYAIFGRNLVQYRDTYSYFLYLEYLVNLLVENGVRNRKFNEDLVKKIVAGYGVVIRGIKHCVDMDLKVVGLERCVQKLDKILLHLDGPLLHFDLVKLYFDVHNAMMVYRKTNFFDTCPEIVWKIFFPKLKLEFLRGSLSNLLFNQYIFEDTIFMKLFAEEEFKEDHSLLLTYIEILHNIMNVKFQHKSFQLSGVTYLFNFVFLQHQSWNYKDEHQKTRITLGCLKIFHYILQKRPEDLNQAERQIFDLCHHAFLNNAYLIESFLKLFIKEKYHMIFLMERESNWLRGPSLDKLQCIRMQLALLLLVMNHRMSLKTRCVFDERLAFAVKPVASYFTNSYSPRIAELSCRFLEKLAQDRYIPLLALLELDHYQVQSLFLERLRDPLEEDEVKLAIIDLINTCIANQDGMTAAFFNLKCFMYWDGTDADLFSGDTVSDFMVDYLQNIKKSHEYFKNPLQLGILRLLYNLWQTHRENLIDNIADLKDFWPVMIEPFFCDFVQEVEVYTVILKIINFEISTDIDNVDKKLIDTLDKFVKNKKQLNLCLEFILKECTDSSKKDANELLSAWMEFLILTKKVMRDSYDDEAKIKLILSCLDGLNYLSSGFNDVGMIFLWCQLYLFLITNWPVYTQKEDHIIRKLSNFIHTLTSYYKYLTPKIKELVLCIVNRTIIDLERHFESNTNVLLSFLYSVGNIVDMEYEYLVSEVWHVEYDLERVKQVKPWLVIIFIGNSLLSLSNCGELSLWFAYREFLKRVMNSIRHLLESRLTLPFAKIAVDHMMTYAQSPLCKDFLKIDLYHFFGEMRPPALTISVGEAILSGIPVNLKEWWLIFTAMMRLNRLLLNSLGSQMREICFAFIAQHDQPLKEIICLTKYTVDMTALTLVSETLKFMYDLLCLKPFWFVEAPYSYELIMEGAKTTINACVLSILGSKKINFYNIIHGRQLDIINNPPTDLLVSVLNKLIEIIYWGSSCLKKLKPDLINLLDVTTVIENYPLLIVNDFSVPRFELPITSKLTYGMLLCLAHYLCKTLNQLSPETPTLVPMRRQVLMTELQDQIKVKNLGEIFEHCSATYEKYIGFMVYLQRSDDLPNEKLSSFLHYDMTEFSGSSAVSKLDYNNVKNALEALMAFLACEIWFTIRILDEDALFAYKRELSSEIQFFYEFVRKKTSELYNTAMPSGSYLQNESDIIKKYMITRMNSNMNDIAERNFVLVISQWLVKLCQLSN